MKNYIIVSALILISAFAKAQQNKLHLDTIYANEQKNVALFFPETVRQGITGSEDFVFTYNREKPQYFGLLQATPGKESNLLVINRNGAIFSYIVKYKEELTKLNYFITESNSIGNEKPMIADTLSKNQSGIKIDNRTYYYQKFCSYLVQRNQTIGRIKKRNSGIILSIENIVFDKDELYVVIQIENKSSLDYDLNFLKFSTETRQKGKRKSLQRLHQKPNYVHNRPLRIKENETVKLVYVLPKFSLSNDRRVILSLNEKDGERDIELKVAHTYINNPN